jgi:hypothetical protein
MRLLLGVNPQHHASHPALAERELEQAPEIMARSQLVAGCLQEFVKVH